MNVSDWDLAQFHEFFSGISSIETNPVEAPNWQNFDASYIIIHVMKY